MNDEHKLDELLFVNKHYKYNKINIFNNPLTNINIIVINNPRYNYLTVDYYFGSSINC